MKCIIIPDISLSKVPDLNAKLFSIIENEHLDVVILLGGLFNHNQSDFQNQESSSKPSQKTRKKNKKDSPNVNGIMSLNWLGKPILAIPSQSDLDFKKAIKQIQSQDAIFIRYLSNSSTIVDGWLFVSLIPDLSENDSNISYFFDLNEENIIFLTTGMFPISNNKLKLQLISSKEIKNNNPDSFIVQVNSNNQNLVKIVDFKNKVVNSINLI